LVAMEGSVGYGIGSARVELEIGYERFKTKGIIDSGSKEDEADTVYLLAKELAYDVVNHQEERLATALAKYEGKDIVPFANAVKISHPKIDEQVCNKNHAVLKTGQGTTFDPDPKNTDAKTAQCSGLHVQGTNKFSDFAEGVGLKDNKNWPRGQAGDSGGTAKLGNADSNAKAVAKDLIDLNRDEKIIVAGLLAKTIEGGFGC
ncbi:P44/Msp2 family outer membrane protein, partial [Anaplasma phagocytophilum]|uniref:P44/Msp2 family outer membrane protein n=1 Tax=Anaplasma phagocytophilum TaxID=948 RepID=UPI000AC07F9A